MTESAPDMQYITLANTGLAVQQQCSIDITGVLCGCICCTYCNHVNKMASLGSWISFFQMFLDNTGMLLTTT